MKILKNLYPIAILLFAVVLLIGGCKKDTIELNKNNIIQNETNNVTLKHGILNFSDRTTFEKIYSELIMMSKEQADEWEKKLGFVSQRYIFNQIVDAENAWNDKYQNYSQEELKKISPHSELYYKYVNNGLIKVFDEGTENESYNYSVFNPSYTYVINEQGFVAIGDSIYQLTADKLKIITDGDFDKIKNIAEINSSNNNIIVENKQNIMTQISRGEWDWGGNTGWIASGSSVGSKRIRMSVAFSSNLYSTGKGCSVTYNVNVQCEQRKTFGGWTKVTTYTAINGNWNARLWLSDYSSVSYQQTFSYAGGINNFWSSIRPTASNSVAPYPSSFLYTAPSPLTFWYEMDVYNAHWSASRDGGPHGLLAKVDHQ